MLSMSAVARKVVWPVYMFRNDSDRANSKTELKFHVEENSRITAKARHIDKACGYTLAELAQRVWGFRRVRGQIFWSRTCRQLGGGWQVGGQGWAKWTCTFSRRNMESRQELGSWGREGR